jgi:hypothetical protein
LEAARRFPVRPPRLCRTLEERELARDIRMLSGMPGTPQYNYQHGIGWYKLLRCIHVITDYFSSRSVLWWIMVFGLIFFCKFLRMTIWSDFAWEEAAREDPSKQPHIVVTQQQIWQALGGRQTAPVQVQPGSSNGQKR